MYKISVTIESMKESDALSSMDVNFACRNRVDAHEYFERLLKAFEVPVGSLDPDDGMKLAPSNFNKSPWKKDERKDWG